MGYPDSMKILVTGGCGFIGSNFVRMALARGAEVINLDALTYAGNPENLKDVAESSQYHFAHTDIRNFEDLKVVFEGGGKIDAVVHFAAESHVDRSIENPDDFISTNVLGTANLLRLAHAMKIEKFVQVSTDEVYGMLKEDDPPFVETLGLEPNSPYSASKAAGDLLVQSYVRTFRFPAVITRCSNNYGPYQYPEKLIPLMLSNCMNDINLPVYGDGRNIRDWIYVEDHCRGVWDAMEKGRVGEVYNFGGNAEKRNLEVVELILSSFPQTKSKIEYVTDRLGHDWRYAMNASKAKSELGWEPLCDFKEGIHKTINWYKENTNWWEPLLQK